MHSLAVIGPGKVLAGANQPAVQLLVYAMNAALKNIGTTLVTREIPRNPRTQTIVQLARQRIAPRDP